MSAETRHPSTRVAERASTPFAAHLVVALLAVLLAVLLPSAGAAQAPTAEALTAQAIVARHDSLVGGRAALEGHRSVRMVGTFAIPALGIDAPLEILKVRPNKYLFRTTFGPLGESLSGFDGTTAWAVHPGQGAILLEKEMARQVADQADFFGDFHDLSRFDAVERATDAEFQGRRVQRVYMIRAGGDTITEFFDAASGLSAGTLTSVGGAMGRSQTTTLVGAYKSFGPLMVATRMEQRTPQFTLLIAILSVEFDTIDEAEVALPESVRALIKP